MKLSILIPTFNRAAILEKTIRALWEQDFEQSDFEIIVIDDGSTDNTKEILQKLATKVPNLKVIHQKNTGQGLARNHGLKQAKGEVALLLGDDMIPSGHEFFKHHWNAHQKYPQPNDAVLGKIDWPPNLPQNDFMKWMTNGSSIFGKFGGHQFAYEKLDRGETPDFNFFYTSNLSLKRKFLGENPFDADFSKYGWEDIELGYRLQKEKGLKMHYNKHALTYHDHPIDESGLQKRMEMIGRSAHIIDKKYPELKKVPGFWKKLAFRLIQLMDILTLKQLKAFHYYALSKKYFLKGVRSGYNKRK